MQLTTSGLPIELDQDKNILSFPNNLAVEEINEKSTSKLKGVMAQPELGSDDIAFRFYKGIYYEYDSPIFQEYSLRYDITFLLPGLMGSERKKTTGHFHKLLPGKSVSHAELYEVLQGTALYILQPIDDMSNTAEGMQVKKIILVKLEAGSKIVVPANCSHCTVNYGTGPLIFSNLVLDSGANEYGGIAMHRGMGVYVTEVDNQLRIIPNPSYDLSNTEIYEGSIVPDSRFGTTLDLPVYKDFINNPEKFKYLKDPSFYIDAINDGVKHKTVCQVKCDTSYKNN